MNICVVTAVNDQYVFPLAVMLRSAAQAMPPDATLCVSILTRGLRTQYRRQLTASLEGLRVQLEEIRVDPSPLAGLRVDGHISLETYFRLLAPLYLPGHERILYLDADLLVRDSIVDLFQRPFDGAHILAVAQASRRSGFFGSERGVPAFAALGISGDARTFNAGVMLLDLERWRRSGTTEAILRYLREFADAVLWWDQDGLNAILHSSWRPLDARWNVMTSHLAGFETWADSLLDEDTFKAAVAHPGIIHYSFVPKPWTDSYAGPFAEEWREASNAVAPFFKNVDSRA